MLAARPRERGTAQWPVEAVNAAAMTSGLLPSIDGSFWHQTATLSPLAATVTCGAPEPTPGASVTGSPHVLAPDGFPAARTPLSESHTPTASPAASKPMATAEARALSGSGMVSACGTIAAVGRGVTSEK